MFASAYKHKTKIFAISTTALLTLMTLVTVADTHGAHEVNATLTMSPWKMASAITSSPAAENEEIEPGQIGVIFKFGCEDCESTYQELKEKLGPDVVWISSRSDIGRKYVERYAIGAVPTGIYVKRNVEGNQQDIIQTVLYVDHGEDEASTLDKNAVEELLEAKKRGL